MLGERRVQVVDEGDAVVRILPQLLGAADEVSCDEVVWQLLEG